MKHDRDGHIAVGEIHPLGGLSNNWTTLSSSSQLLTLNHVSEFK